MVAASYDWLGERLAQRVLIAMIPIGVGFFAITQVSSGAFLVFVVYEVVAMLVALGIYLFLTVRRLLPGAGLMAFAIVLNIVATESVRFTIIWPFDHNGVFHIVQLIAVLVLMLGLQQSFQARPSQ